MADDFLRIVKIFLSSLYFYFLFFVSPVCLFCIGVCVFVTHGSFCPVSDQGLTVATGICVQKVILSGLTFEPNLCALLSGHFGLFVLLLDTLRVFCSVISNVLNTLVFSVRSFRTDPFLLTRRGLVSGHFGLLLHFACLCPVISDCLSPCVLLSSYFGQP